LKKILVCLLSLLLVANLTNGAYALKKKPVKNNKPSKVVKTTSTKKVVTIHSEAAILMDMTSGKILYSKNMHEKLYPASTTKILTAIIAIENGNLNSIVTIGKAPTLVEPSRIDLKIGEKIQLKQLLYALLVDSANDAAVAISEYIGGSQANFIKMMNKKAKLLGCKDSNFANPNGLPNKNHKTSAYDLALITKYAMNNSSFRIIDGKKTYTIPATNKSKARQLTNHNKMILASSGHYYSACIGGKTGYTVAAQNTLVSVAAKGSKKLIAIVLKDTPTYVYTDNITMFNYGFNIKK
jgi:serine-type D-Ala-D-Ala carboxypeptidase (penicillin-binding protein 5/6)